LKTFLVNQSGHEVVTIDHCNTEPIDELSEREADVVLLDLNLPDGLAVEISRALNSNMPETKIILLVPAQHDRLVECIATGAHGCVLEDSSLEDLESAIKRVLAGEAFCSPDIVSTMFAEIARFAKTTSWQPPKEPKEKRLTIRELEVLELLNLRKSNKEIAAKLSVSLFTVKNHVRNILDKLNAENRMEAVDVARQQHKLNHPQDRPNRRG
jgi:two-component system NarL family response regulator